MNYEASSSHSITLRATSADGSFTTQTMLINVIDVNEAPVGGNDSYSVSFIDVLTVMPSGLLGNDSDIDGNTLSVFLVSGPSVGNLVLLSDGSFIYTPQVNYVGPTSFTYRVSDGILTSGDVTVTIAVTLPSNINPGGGGSGGNGSNGSGGSGSGSGTDSGDSGSGSGKTNDGSSSAISNIVAPATAPESTPVSQATVVQEAPPSNTATAAMVGPEPTSEQTVRGLGSDLILVMTMGVTLS